MIEQSKDAPKGQKGFSLINTIQFLGASSIVGVITWSIGSFMSAKANQQQQLNTFIVTISNFMIQDNLDGQPSTKARLPAVSRAARGYALNTLSILDGNGVIEDKPKKLALLRFLYDSELIGFCKNSVLGSKSLAQKASEEECQQSRINLKDARLKGLEFAGLGLVARGIDLSGANLSSSDFSNLDLAFSTFHRSTLSSARFSNSILQQANLSYAVLIDSDLSNADLTQSILSNAQLCGADLAGAEGLETAHLKNVTFDKNTVLPGKIKDLLIANGGIFAGPDEAVKSCKVSLASE